MITWKFSFSCLLILAVASTAVYAQDNRDYPIIVGSSTVYPLAEQVGQRFSEKTGMKAPEIQSTGTGGGIKLFCAGAGLGTPDIANASRPIKSTEVDLCVQNGVDEIVEVIVGYDAIVVVSQNIARPLNLTRKELFLALAKDVPDPQDGAQLVPNPYHNWQDINPELPDRKINVWSPDKSHGTHDLIVSNIMVAGCKQLNLISTMEQTNPEGFNDVCKTFREDEAYTEDAEYENILAAVKREPDAAGILSYLFLAQDNSLQGSEIDGYFPTYPSIANNIYPLTRPLRFYVKKAHVDVIPGLREFVDEFTSEEAWGITRGYLVKYGMIPMLRSERRNMKAAVKELKPLSF